MKKVFLSLIMIAAIVASCKKVETGDTTDLTDSIQVETINAVDTTNVVKDTLVVE